MSFCGTLSARWFVGLNGIFTDPSSPREPSNGHWFYRVILQKADLENRAILDEIYLSGSTIAQGTVGIVDTSETSQWESKNNEVDRMPVVTAFFLKGNHSRPGSVVN